MEDKTPKTATISLSNTAPTYVSPSPTTTIHPDHKLAIYHPRVLAEIFARYKLPSALPELQAAITAARETVAATPPENPDRAAVLYDLSFKIGLRSMHTGATSDTNEAIELEIGAVDATPATNEFRADWLSDVSTRLLVRYREVCDITDLHQAVARAEQAVAATKPGSELPKRLSLLATQLGMRYRVTGEVADIDNALARMQEAINALPEHDFAHSLLNSNTASLLDIRYWRTRNLDDLQEAVVWIEKAVAATPNGHPFLADLVYDLGARLANLSRLLGVRYQERGGRNVLEKAIARAEQAVKITPQDHPDLPTRLNILASNMGLRYQLSGVMGDIDAAIALLRKAIAGAPENYPDHAVLLDSLACHLVYKFKGTDKADISILQEAIQRENEALALNHAKKLEHLQNLSNMMEVRYHATRNFHDLEDAIRMVEDVLEKVPLGHANHADLLMNYGGRLHTKYMKTRDIKDLENAITQAEEAVKEALPGRAVTLMLSNLSTYVDTRFERTGALVDLERAIQLAQQALEGAEDGSLERMSMLHSLSNRLEHRYMLARDFEDLRNAIALEEEATKITEENPNRKGYINDLGNKLELLYTRTKDPNDLENAIRWAELAVKSTLPDDKDQPGFSNNLSNKLETRFKLNRNAEDLRRAIELSEVAAAAARSSDSPNLPSILTNLSCRLALRYENTKSMESESSAADLDRAIVLAKEAVDAVSVDKPDRAVYMYNLSVQIKTRFDRTKAASDSKAASSYLQEVFELENSPPTIRINAAILAADFLIAAQKWDDARTITSSAVKLLPLLSPRSLAQNDQQDALMNYPGLASLAAATALNAGGPAAAENALSLLEMGRGIITGFRFETRTDLSVLWERRPDIATQLEKLRNELDSPSNPLSITAVPTIDSVFTRRSTANSKLTALIESVRLLPGFEKFLFPPEPADLMAAAAGGTIICINVSFRCDALIIQPHGIRALHLPELQPNCIEKYVKVLSNKDREEGDMSRVLNWLWDVAAKPILAELEFTKTPAVGAHQWPHVWWVLTGAMCLFPIHAAGIHSSSTLETVLDRVVSSYTPSVKALLFTRRNKARKETSLPADERAVLISMDQTPGCEGLDFVNAEVKAVGEILPTAIGRKPLDKPSKKDVLDELINCSIFHFAGHAESDPTDPSKSRLLVNAGKADPVTAQDLIGLKLHRSAPRLAYLSACSTGDNQVVKLLDEGIHLVGAFQLVGFQHVIGSLWTLKDSSSVVVAEAVYGEMVATGLSDESVSLGLHKASRALRTGTSETKGDRGVVIVGRQRSKTVKVGNPLVWASYIHTGI